MHEKLCNLLSAYYFVSHYQAILHNMLEIMHLWAEVVLCDMMSIICVLIEKGLNFIGFDPPLRRRVGDTEKELTSH